jgi:hypothetical protein
MPQGADGSRRSDAERDKVEKRVDAFGEALADLRRDIGVALDAL